MRIVVFSDSHRMTSRVFEIIERHKDNADLFIFLGDGNDDVSEAMMIYPDIKIERVSGNCDFSCEYPAQKLIEFASKKIFFTHGHPYYVKHNLDSLERESQSLGADICLFGHTHIPYIAKKDGISYLNPGSCSVGSYGIIDIESGNTLLYHSSL